MITTTFSIVNQYYRRWFTIRSDKFVYFRNMVGMVYMVFRAVSEEEYNLF